MTAAFVIDCLEMNSVDLLEYDVNTICRTCTSANAATYKNVYESSRVIRNEETGNNYDISEILQILTQESVEKGDGLPERICMTCMKNLFSCFNFVALAKRVNRAFKTYLKDSSEPEYQEVADEEEQLITIEQDHVMEEAAEDTEVSEEREDTEIESFIPPMIEMANEEVEEEVTTIHKTDIKQEEVVIEYVEEEVEEAQPLPTKPNRKRRAVVLPPKCEEATIPIKIRVNKKMISNTTTTPTSPTKPPGVTQGQLDCNICDKVFSSHTSLLRHMMIHDDSLTVTARNQCPHCERSFARGDVLKRHIRTHTGERPFQCPECPKCFKQKSEVKDHMSKHRREHSFLCQEPDCPKTFTTRMGLYLHKRFHLKQKMEQEQEHGETE